MISWLETILWNRLHRHETRGIWRGAHADAISAPNFEFARLPLEAVARLDAKEPKKIRHRKRLLFLFLFFLRSCWR